MKHHELKEETPRVIHHIVKDPDLLRTLLDAYFEEHQRALRQVLLLIETLHASPLQGMIGSAAQQVENQDQLREGEERKPGR